MLKPCGIWELPKVYRLWRRGVSLDMPGAVGGDVPWWPFLSAALSGPGEGATIYLFEDDDQGESACVQALRRPHRPEADLVYIAPEATEEPTRQETWRRLLEETTQTLGQEGVERVYAGVPERGPEVEAFRGAGFNLYSREEIFCLDAERDGEWPPGGQLPLQPRASEHDWGLGRLYHELVPWLVQQAEGRPGGGGFPTPPWAGPVREYVLTEEGEVIALVQMASSPAAHWLWIVLHPRAHHWADSLIRAAADRLAASPRRPVYCAVRHYQGGLQAPLEENGFQWVGTRALLVRHTTARIPEVEPRRVEGMEKRPGAAFPTALIRQTPADR